MAGRASYLLSLPVVACLLGALTLVLVLVGRNYGLGILTFALLAAPIVLAVAYVAWYRTLPYEPARPRAPLPPDDAEPDDSAAVPDEPFEDPVEEADRIDAGLEAPDETDPPATRAIDSAELERPPPSWRR